MPYMLSYPTWSHVSHALCHIFSRVQCTLSPTCCRAWCPSCFTSSRSLRDSYHTCSPALRVSCPTYYRVSRARALRAPKLHVSLALCVLVPHVVLCLTCHVSYVPLYFKSSFSLRNLVPRALHLCANITFCALEFPCLTLLFFYSFRNCERVILGRIC